MRAASAGCVSVGDWLAVALAPRSPAVSLAALDDASSDRVLAAEATGTVRAAWMSRGALELLALRSLARESRELPRAHPRDAAYTVAVAHVARRPAPAVGTSNARAWRAHSLALARSTATYLQACEGNDGWRQQTRAELLSLLADSLAQAARLDTHQRQ